MKTIVPGKLIISGEHAVVYQKPAIAATINRFVEATIIPSASQQIIFNTLNTRAALAYDELAALKKHVDHRYQLFLTGNGTVSAIFHRPEELVQYVVADIIAKHPQHIVSGFELQFSGNLPLQCGMGSSASGILSTLLSVTRYFELLLSHEELTQWAIDLEHYQHGKSSGFDVQTIMTGGVVFRENKNVRKMECAYPFFYAVNTGRPQSSTGECVSKVKHSFENSTLWNEFEKVTLAVKKSLEEKNVDDLKIAVRQNHQLLNTIGVVPTKINQFIQEIETHNAAAKICGAGSVRGDEAGFVLIIGDQVETLLPVCERYGFTLETVAIEVQGAHYV